MPQIEVFVRLTKDKANTNLKAVNGTFSVERTLPTSKIETKESLANWLLSQVSNIFEQDEARQGILTIDYHTEQIQEEGVSSEILIVDNVTKKPLPLILRRNLQASLTAIDSVIADTSVKQALKQMVKSIWFLNSFK